jgi:hypothetical protein
MQEVPDFGSLLENFSLRADSEKDAGKQFPDGNLMRGQHSFRRQHDLITT